jgi:hypothetical protein
MYGDLNLVQLTNMYTEHTAMRYCLWLLIVQVNDESVYFMKLCRRYTFIACWWGKYENVFTQKYHIPWGQHPRGIWYSWVNTFSYFLNPHAMNVLLYRMKPRKHIHVKYRWQTNFKSIGTLSQSDIQKPHTLQIVTVACKWCVASASDVFCQRTITLARKPARLPRDGIWFLFHRIWFLCCVITCSDFYPFSNQINLW